MKLVYFNAPARAAAPRLMLSIAKKPYEDVIVAREQWATLKPTVIGGALPLLELDDGRKISQSGAISAYIGGLTGCYPADSWHVALGEQAIGFTNDATLTFYPYFLEKDPEAKAAKLKDILEGDALKFKLGALQEICCKAEKGDFIAGDKPIWADYVVFCFMCSFVAGFYGAPRDFWTQYPDLNAYKQRIASIPEVREYHAARADNPMYATYQPDA